MRRSPPGAPKESSSSVVDKMIFPGDYIHTWKVLKKVGEGGFGDVYEVENEQGEQYALKTEKIEAVTRTLKMEVVVLKALKFNKRLAHFCEMVDAGRDSHVNFVVMTLIGRTLSDIKKSYAKDGVPGRFSLRCALSLGIECLEAIHHLHDSGYVPISTDLEEAPIFPNISIHPHDHPHFIFLHRDLKPSNFAVARNDPRRIILFDFGLCRRFIDSEKNIRRPRWATGFRGTLRYASISVHISREMSPKDDVESWFYQQVELTVGSLPWGQEDNLDKICQMKERARDEGLESFLKNCPAEYHQILNYLDELRYYDLPNYSGLQKILEHSLKTSGGERYPYDWEE